MMPRMSSSRMIRKLSPSILISVPPYFEISTLSPFFTVNSTFLPSSFTLPVPRATTLPSCGFSLAVSGIMIPPFFVSVSSIGCTSTRSPRGFTLIAICFISLLLLCFLLFLFVFVDDLELRIDYVAVATACARALFSAWSRTSFRSRLRTGLTGLRALRGCLLIKLRADFLEFVLQIVIRALHRVGVIAINRIAHRAVRVDIECDFDLRHAARGRRNSIEMECPEILVITRKGSLTLQDFDFHAGLIIAVSRKDLRFPGRDRGVTWDHRRSHAACSFNR